jgi:hypothetical protein
LRIVVLKDCCVYDYVGWRMGNLLRADEIFLRVAHYKQLIVLALISSEKHKWFF